MKYIKTYESLWGDRRPTAEEMVEISNQYDLFDDGNFDMYFYITFEDRMYRLGQGSTYLVEMDPKSREYCTSEEELLKESEWDNYSVSDDCWTDILYLYPQAIFAYITEKIRLR